MVGQGPGNPRVSTSDDRSPTAFKVQGPVRVGERCVCVCVCVCGAPREYEGDEYSGVQPTTAEYGGVRALSSAGGNTRVRVPLLGGGAANKRAGERAGEGLCSDGRGRRGEGREERRERAAHRAGGGRRGAECAQTAAQLWRHVEALHE